MSSKLFAVLFLLHQVSDWALPLYRTESEHTVSSG